MGAPQQFSLRWNNYVHHITSAFDNLRTCEDLVDVTLVCDRKKIYAHKMLLSACSEYFKDVFKENPCKHPVIIFRNVKYEDLLAIIDFMYHGEVNVEQEQLTSFLTTAEMLAVQGLSVGSSPPKEETRKRQAIFLDSMGPTHETFQTRTLPSKIARPSSAQNAPPPPIPKTSVTACSSPRRRRPSPPRSQSEPIEKPVKKQETNKGEPEDVAESSSFTEEDGMMDVSELELSREGEDPIEHIKEEGDHAPDEVSEKLAAFTRAGLAGSSANQESLEQNEYSCQDEQEEGAGEEEEYLEEEEDDDYEYVVISDDGTMHYVDDEKSEIELLEEGGDGQVLVVENDQEAADVEFVYETDIDEMGDVFVGEAPTFTCRECDRVFKRHDSLLKHAKMHAGRTVCAKCNRMFSRVSHLTRHVKQKHPEVPLILRKGRPPTRNLR